MSAWSVSTVQTLVNKGGDASERTTDALESQRVLERMHSQLFRVSQARRLSIIRPLYIKESRRIEPAVCVNPLTANLDVQYALRNGCPIIILAKLKSGYARKGNPVKLTFLAGERTSTDHTPPGALIYHLLCCVLVTEERPANVDS